MARSIEQIETDLKSNSPEIISNLNTERTTSVLGAIFYAVAFAIYIVETIFDQHKVEIDNIIKQRQPGTREWYAAKSLEYKGGVPYSVVDNQIVFEDEVADFTIARVSVREVADSDNLGFIRLKVAKEVDSVLEPLTGTEKALFTSYIEDVKFVGTPIEIVSVPPNKLRVDASVFYDPAYSVDEIRQNINDALNNYMATLRFDAMVYNSEIFDTLYHTEGVRDVELSGVFLDGVEVVRVAESPAGYLVEDDGFLFNNRIDLFTS